MDGFDFFAHGRTAASPLACAGAGKKLPGGRLPAVGGSTMGRALGTPAKPQGQAPVAARAAPRPEASRASGGAAVRTETTESRLDAAYRDRHHCDWTTAFETFTRDVWARRP